MSWAEKIESPLSPVIQAISLKHPWKIKQREDHKTIEEKRGQNNRCPSAVITTSHIS